MNQHDLKHSLIYGIKRAYSSANQRADALLQPYGLGRTQWHIVYYLAHHGPMAQRQLQEVLQIESATLTTIIASMVRKGWVAQIPSDVDKRKKDLKLTAEGKRLRGSLPDPVLLIEQATSKGLSEDEINQARTILEKISKNLEQE